MVDLCFHCRRQLDDPTPVEISGWRLSSEITERNGTMLNLSRSEAHILFVLAGARGKVVSAEMVGERFSGSGTPQNTVRVLITRIRKKLGEACPIETVHGRGYRWNADETRRARPSLQPRRSRTAAGH